MTEPITPIDQAKRLAQLQAAFASGILDADTYQALVAALHAPPTSKAEVSGVGAIAQDHSTAAGARGAAIAGDLANSPIITGDHVIFAAEGATVVFGEAPIAMPAVNRESALGQYLRHLIGRNRYLQLQGIRSGGKLVHIELDRIYIRLRATQQRVIEAEERWLAAEAEVAPGELQRRHPGTPAGPRLTTETVTVAVEAALASYPRLIILGDPGSGKTTLLRYLALLYARDRAENSALVQTQLIAAEPHRLPIPLPLRQVGVYLQSHADASIEGHTQLLAFLHRSLQEERISLPADFFDDWLDAGKAVILLDGLDEVADPDLRRRVARLVESFTRAYPTCRYVVTSRIVGYTGSARLGESYMITTVRDFTLADVEQFLANWHRLVAIGQAGDSPSAAAYAAAQTRQLLEAIETNERIRELAINPLMLTVIAMVHRDRVKLPDRRAELYAEAVDVLLGKWDEARGVQEWPILPAQPFETNDKRLLLESVALTLHATGQKEIGLRELSELLAALFDSITGDERTSDQAVTRFLAMIQERTGLLVARGEGVFTFSHLTFQEYLAARAIAARDDYVAYTLDHLAEPWWREVILLAAGYLSTQSKERTTRLIRAIADHQSEPEPYHNLVLAADCLRDAGASRVEGNLEALVHQRLRKGLATSPPFLRRWFKNVSIKAWIEGRSRAMEALVRAGIGFWTLPHGEPEWIAVPAGEFWLGGAGQYDGKPQQRLHLPAFRIARTPITNAQYYLFTQATGHPAPAHWEENRPPKGLESHPVVHVAWRDALAYCTWLSQTTHQSITLPSEAEWEKAARGDQDQRAYPWGETFDATQCNCNDLGLHLTTPVGIFPAGASPYGCLDMAGNVWEWTLSQYSDYPYDPTDGREDLAGNANRVLRGGSFYHNRFFVRCAYRDRSFPNDRDYNVGFRVVSPGL